jgi:hypothetical protein
MNLEQLIEKDFALTPPNSQALLNLTSSSEFEAVEQTAVFKGKNWKEILPAAWKGSPRAVFFFNDSAFGYYLPSLMSCSLKNYSLAKSALENLWFKLRDLSVENIPQGAKSKTSLTPEQFERARNRQRLQWRQFNADQIRTILAWMLEISDFEASGEKKYAILQAREVLRRICERK